MPSVQSFSRTYTCRCKHRWTVMSQQSMPPRPRKCPVCKASSGFKQNGTARVLVADIQFTNSGAVVRSVKEPKK